MMLGNTMALSVIEDSEVEWLSLSVICHGEITRYKRKITEVDFCFTMNISSDVNTCFEIQINFLLIVYTSK